MARTLLLTVHIAAVALWLGANAVQLSIGSRFTSADRSAALTWLQATRWMAERYYNVAGVLIGVTGVALVLHGDWSWGAGFIWVGVIAIVIGAVLGIVEFLPTNTRMIAATEAGDTATVAALTRRSIRFAVLDTSVVVITVVAMVHKWAA
jgi:hypothetical protein